MTNQSRNLLIGGLAGLLVLVITYFLLGGKRDDLAALKASNTALQLEVNRGYALRQNYEKLKAEVADKEKQIDLLMRLLPTEADRNELPFRIKKLADTAGIEQVSFTLLPPAPKDYYTEYPVQFAFRAGYHTLGQFTSLVSGYDKIVNITDLQMKREGNNALYPMTVNCKVSAFVAKPADATTPAPAAPGARPGKPAPAAKKDQGD